MTTYIALFRAINVGGRNKLPMKNLRAILEALGAAHVLTYVQSGNAVFSAERGRSNELSKKIAETIESRHGFLPGVMVLTSSCIARAIERNPFPEAESEPKSLHVYFLAAAPDHVDRDKLESLKSESERYLLDGDLFYLNAPDGIARSKLAAGAEKALGVVATGRNWNTVCKIRDMVRDTHRAPY